MIASSASEPTPGSFPRLIGNLYKSSQSTKPNTLYKGLFMFRGARYEIEFDQQGNPKSVVSNFFVLNERSQLPEKTSKNPEPTYIKKEQCDLKYLRTIEYKECIEQAKEKGRLKDDTPTPSAAAKLQKAIRSLKNHKMTKPHDLMSKKTEKVDEVSVSETETRRHRIHQHGPTQAPTERSPEQESPQQVSTRETHTMAQYTRSLSRQSSLPESAQDFPTSTTSKLQVLSLGTNVPPMAYDSTVSQKVRVGNIKQASESEMKSVDPKLNQT